MWSVALFAAAIYLIVKAFQFHFFAGIGAIAALLAYGYFRWYTEFCIGKAKSVYSKNPEEALKWFERAYKHGMNIGQQETYAYYLMREGEGKRAEEIYHHLLRQNLKNELRLKIRSDLAVLYMKTDRIDEALEELEDITVHYINTTTYGSLGYLYLVKKNKRRAVSYNLEAYDYNSDDPVILDNLIQLYIMQEDYQKAQEYAELLLEKEPYFIEAYYDSAYVYFQLGDTKRAEEILARGDKCRITFMSTVKEADVAALKEAISTRNHSHPHKLGTFSEQGEEETALPVENLVYCDEEETVIEYDEPDDGDFDENDPFI